MGDVIVTDDDDETAEAVEELAEAVEEAADEEREHHEHEEHEAELDRELEHEKRHAAHEQAISELWSRPLDVPTPEAPVVDVDAIVDAAVDEVLDALEMASLVDDGDEDEEVVTPEPVPDVTEAELEAAKPRSWWSSWL